MMKRNRLIFVCSVVVILCFLCCCLKVLFFAHEMIFPISYNDVEKKFEKNKEHIFSVKEYLENLEYEDIYISITMKQGTMSINGNTVNIKSKEITSAINKLEKQGCKVLGKKGDTIYLQLWSDLDSSRGIAYSDNKVIGMQFLADQKPLKENNWYYYEEDYNEWELQNYTNGIPNKFLGRWNIECIKVRGTGEEYPIQNLEGFVGKVGAEMTFNSDGTFQTESNTKYGLEKCSGKYILRYEEKILLKYDDGSEGTVKYLSNNYQMVYYTVDSNQVPIDVYYKKLLGD